MTGQQWRRIEGVFHQAADFAPRDRAEFLRRACAGDDELRCEVESLLAGDNSQDNLLHAAVAKAVRDLPSDSNTGGSLPVGLQIGPYIITSLIGKGGMGEVYRARDTRLKRDVALKVLPAALEQDEILRRRFEQEARLVATLNHPNISTLFDVGPNYLVMELIEGPTLADRIKEGPIPLDEALAIAKQIADALEAAHEKGIVHRDLKPGNVKIRLDGSVKVLDFGLAKAGGAETTVTQDSPTLTQSPTQPGAILGTAAYMAPEQARGKTVDKRADIWSFGVVLYEMLTGKHLFEGEDLAETLASVVKSEPNLAPIPRKVRRLLAKCLEKDPKRRLRDIGDAWELLDAEADAQAVAAPPVRPGNIWLALALAGLTLAAGTVLLLRLVTPPQIDLSSYKFTPIARTEANEAYPAWSPDGESIAYSMQTHGVYQVFTKVLGAIEPAQLTHSDKNCVAPFWSRDGATIYYGSDGDLWAVSSSGGAPERVMEKAYNSQSCIPTV